jgi:hypothetical protein
MIETYLDEILIRCSSLSCLFTEPQSKADKDAGNLSKTAKSHLVEVYANVMWGYERDIQTKQMRKGTYAEEEGITLLSKVDGRLYEKNADRMQNDWISGHADIVTEDEIIDIKLSWDAFTFLPKLIDDVDKCYYYQLQGYMWLWDKEVSRICYCLVNTPQNIIEGEKYKLLRSMDVVSEESPEFIKAAERLENNMKFDKIPIEQRIISQKVYRDEEIISRIPEKVEKAREFISNIYKIHFAA